MILSALPSGVGGVLCAVNDASNSIARGILKVWHFTSDLHQRVATL